MQSGSGGTRCREGVVCRTIGCDSSAGSMYISTVQLRGKLTLASDSLASATAYTRECERGHSRTSVECSRVLHPSLACYSRVLDPSLACLILASARPLARVCYLRLLDRSLACVTCDCSTARSRVTCECWKLESSAHGPRPSARRGKLIRP